MIVGENGLSARDGATVRSDGVMECWSNGILGDSGAFGQGGDEFAGGERKAGDFVRGL